MIRQPPPPFTRLAVAALLLLPAACSMFDAAKVPPPPFYSLSGVGASPPTKAAAARLDAAPTLIVNPPRAAPGFDSQRIIYVREPYQLEYFAHSEWIDTPARMIAPRIVAALEGTGAFRAVVLAPARLRGICASMSKSSACNRSSTGHPAVPASRCGPTWWTVTVARCWPGANSTRQCQHRRPIPTAA